MELTERKLKILQAIVTDFINTAEPVGSRTLAKRYELGVSPATIRNEMSDLEEMGFLTHPHASAGRVPSDKAYRMYVNNLMDKYELPTEEKTRISNQMNTGISELKTAIRHASEMLSELTNLTSFATYEDRSEIDLILEGMTRIFAQPEFNSIDRAKNFLQMVDDRDHLTKALSTRDEGVSITIGEENSTEIMADSAVITATYHIDGRYVGKLGVIGPTRMNYSEVMTLVEYLSNNLNQAFKVEPNNIKSLKQGDEDE
ncbi:MAG: heat-inducible transcriptional repressor HrcA [Clostridiales Family XIII bacterium]|jgi:transcriptional regulator of heat shock response|nr:heat-inducible transcriptional repressor HrcA [Clostridiales Family XIII bacterium]